MALWRLRGSRATIERENTERKLAPVDPVIALGVTGEVAAVVVDERPPVTIGGGSVALIGLLVGARHVEAGNLIIAVGKATVWHPFGRNTTSGIFPSDPVRS